MLIDAINSYLTVRTATGFDMRNDRTALRSYERFAKDLGDTHVHGQTAIAWAALGSSAQQRDRRLKMVIRMARHLAAEDPRHELPPDGVFGHSQGRTLPYLYSREDLRRLLAAATKLPRICSVVSTTYSTLLSLLMATGMRISEALALRYGDFSNDMLLIRRTKFKKSRLIPLHPTAVAGMNRYLEVRRLVGGMDDHLFLNASGQRLQYHSVKYVFLRLLHNSGLYRAKKPRPTIHGLRHLFAASALEACPHDRSSVGRHLAALSTYLGHARLASTYWYLQATPRLLGDIARAAEHFAEGSP